MLSCDWAHSLTKYDCREVRSLNGSEGLEIGTPFSLPDGAAINLYVIAVSDKYVQISDNGDTLTHLSGMGIEVWNAARLKGLREVISKHKVTLHDRGDIQIMCPLEQAALSFALALTGILAINEWAHSQLKIDLKERDIVAEAEPYIIARNPSAKFLRSVKIKGASRAEHVFDFRHGKDLIDIIAPSAQSTGGVMRKVGDVTNGPFADQYSPLIIVDDRFDHERAEKEMGILASIARTQPFSSLAQSVH